MSTEENKAIVRRMLNEVIVGGNLDLMDDLSDHQRSQRIRQLGLLSRPPREAV